MVHVHDGTFDDHAAGVVMVAVICTYVSVTTLKTGLAKTGAAMAAPAAVGTAVATPATSKSEVTARKNIFFIVKFSVIRCTECSRHGPDNGVVAT
jgi:hypothetical protein